MLTLVEPCGMRDLADRPPLGCAMLIAACREHGIETTLVRGQTRYLRNMFITDSEELWHLARDLGKRGAGGLPPDFRREIIRGKGLRDFQAELRELYRALVAEKNFRNFLDIPAVNRFNELHDAFITIYNYHLEVLKNDNLKIVERYVREIMRTRPRYIGFSEQTAFSPLSRAVRRRLRRLTRVPFIVGGDLTPYIRPEKPAHVFEKECFDCLVVGPGERALPALIAALESGKNPAGIPNVFLKNGGKPGSGRLEIINNPDSLPYPDFSQFDLDLYPVPVRVLPLQSARGCSWRRCAFCSHSKGYMGQYRKFSAERVAETLRHLKRRYDCSHFVLNDEELPAAHARDIATEILSKKLNVSIFCHARMTAGYNDSRLLGFLRKAGFSAFTWGLESGSQEILNSMRKGTRISCAGQILRKSAKNKISNLCLVLFGFPGETLKDARRTVRFLERNSAHIDQLLCEVFQFLPFSPMSENPEKWGIKIGGDDGYSVRRGLSRREARRFLTNFQFNLMLGRVKATAASLPSRELHGERMLYFLNSSHLPLPRDIALELLDAEKFDAIFPVIPGGVVKRGIARLFRPLDLRKNCFMNRLNPRAEEPLDKTRERLILLSDGVISLGRIISAVCRGAGSNRDKAAARAECLGFFRKLFSRNSALAFAKSWGGIKKGKKPFLN